MNDDLLTGAFWLGATDRAVKSAAQSLLLLWGSDAGLNLLSISVGHALGFAGGAALVSLLTSVVSAPVGDRSTTSALPGGR